MTTFAFTINEYYSAIQWLEFLLRIVVAALCGAIIGVERSKRLKEAGMRTHCLVACTAAIMMIISKYCFADLGAGNGMFLAGVRGADPARIAAQVVSGVSFLGAGVIFKNGMSIRGLTTAAGIWATSAIGLAIGAGLYWIGIFSTGFIILVQFLMHRFNIGQDAYSSQDITITCEDTPEMLEALLAAQDRMDIQVVNGSVTRNGDGTATYRLTVRELAPITFQEMLRFMQEHVQVKNFSV